MVTFVPTPIGNLEDISKRALTALLEAELIFCEDTRVTKKLLNLYNISLDKKFISMHSHNEDKVISILDKDELINKKCVYVSDAGMPGISDPGSKLIQFCQKNEIPYSVIPGANAALTAFVASGFEGNFTFFGFLPHKGKERQKALEEVLNHDKIAIIYESPHRIEKLITELKSLIPKRTVFLAKELTKLHETYIKTKAKDIDLKNTKGEWVIVIDKGEKNKKLELSYEEISELPLPLKLKAKLLNKITDISTKELYKKLNEEKDNNEDYKNV